MHQRDKFDSIAHLLFHSDPSSPKSYQSAPVYSASQIGNLELFRVLVTQSGISLYETLGQKQKHEIPLPDGTVVQHFITPLSLILSMPQNHNLLDVLEELLNYHQVPFVDLSNTMLPSLPVKLFKLGIYKLYLQNNELTTLPSTNAPRSCWPNLLYQLNVSYNSLNCLPAELFKLPCLETLNVSYNPLESLPEKWWKTKSIKKFDVSHTHLDNLSINFDSDVFQTGIASVAAQPDFPKVINGRVSNAGPAFTTTKFVKTDCLLQWLNASHCLITAFPRLLAIFFPKLETLNLSNNMLQSCCAINEFPISLHKLDISNNLLHYNKHKLFFIDIPLSANSSCIEHNDLCLLNSLNLSNNTSLGNVTICNKESKCCDVFFPNLKRLYLSNCNLKLAPEGLVHLQELRELDISNNTELKIPNEISNLENLISLTYHGVQDPVVYELERCDDIEDKLIVLRQEQLVKSVVVCYSCLY